ncbi:TIGR02281 family clan AA aspartic protease [Rhizobium sp. FKL33]|uniref:retropepsin-like aspartic protease family protein n=1 Tax=Rhizobium sp. FKL33 TaxID=2562307 RepID=UPI0010C0E9DA|nr:TIGR02281 family clan AA aspartic protease [Rhizobium sp. FKL33]
MIGRALLIWSSVIVVAVNVPAMVEPAKKPALGGETAAINVATSPSRSYVLKSNDAGHFEGRFRLNGKPLDAMIDTGATFVTVNEADARNLGYGGNELNFRYEVDTANGPAKAARIQLRSVEIGTVQVRNVDALVLRGRKLASPLIGMSFMRKLDSYSADDSEMRLVN